MNTREQKLFDALQLECDRAELTLKSCGVGHWQISGPTYRVNVYPFAKTPSVYINGMTRGITLGDRATVKAIMHVALNGTELPVYGVRRHSYRNAKKRMLAKSDKCFWCGLTLTMETGTVDHRIPLSKGGLDNANNRVLACEPCNKTKADKLPHAMEANA